MSAEIILVILLIVLTIGLIFVNRKKNGGDSVQPPQTPEIPGHLAEKDGDVNNGKTFSSFSITVQYNTTVITGQEIMDGGLVKGVMQTGANVNEMVLGQIIKAEDIDNLPVPLSSYKYKATEIGDSLLSPPANGDLGSGPKWTLTLPPALDGSTPRPLTSTVYLEVEAPEGYQSGVVVLELRIETGV